MKSLSEAVVDYLKLRRELGFKLDRAERLLRQFVSFVDVRGATKITTRLALDFANEPQLSQASKALRLGAVRCFAYYHVANDPATEVPPMDFFHHRAVHITPYIYSEREIARLLHAVRNEPKSNRFPGPLWHRCDGGSWYCLFALLATTGMRVSEVCNLRDQDIDWQEGVLTVNNTKFGKSRLVPLHDTMLRGLRTYLKHRSAFLERFCPGIEAPRLFVTCRGTPCDKSRVHNKFVRISRRIGLRGPNDRHGPRLHDFRHRFAVQTLVRWYRSGEDAERLLPVLSTYLGHGNVTDTYWYLRCTPELMGAARGRLERRWKGVQ